MFIQTIKYKNLTIILIECRYTQPLFRSIQYLRIKSIVKRVESLDTNNYKQQKRLYVLDGGRRLMANPL